MANRVFSGRLTETEVAYYFDAFIWALWQLKCVSQDTYKDTGSERYSCVDKFVDINKWLSRL